MSSEDKHNFGAPDTPSDFTVPQRDGDASEYGSAKGLEPVWVRPRWCIQLFRAS